MITKSLSKNIQTQIKKQTTLKNIVARSGYSYPRKLAVQNTLIKLIYGGYKEGLFPPYEIVFYLHFLATKSTVRISKAEEAFALIYNRDLNCEFTLQAYQTKKKKITHIPDLVDFWQKILKTYAQKKLADKFDEKNWKLAEQEIFNAVDCDTLAIIERIQLTQELEIKSQHHHTTWEWLTNQNYSSQELEKLLIRMGSIEGHQLHPMAKMRVIIEEESELDWLGLTSYFPEFGNHFPLPLLAISKNQIQITKQSQQVEWKSYVRDNFPDAYQQWLTSLVENSLPSENYQPLPIHPLNLENILTKFNDLVTTKQLVVTNSFVDVYPMISSRSLLPKGGGARIKVTIPQLLLTSVVRSIAPARAHSAPILSDLLEHILTVEENFQDSLRIISEPFGIYFHPDNATPEQQESIYKSGYHLSVIMRDNAQNHLQEGEFAIPLTNLFSRWGKDPKNGKISKPLILDIMYAHGIRTTPEAKSYFINYVDKVLKSLLGIFVRYGVSLEAHQQNTLVVFNKEGSIQSLLVRDLAGGLEIYRDLLEMNQGKEYQITDQLYPGYVYKTLDEDITSPSQQFTHAILQGHIFPLLTILQTEFTFEKTELLLVIRKTITQYIQVARVEHIDKIELAEREKYLEILAQIQEILLQAQTLDKCLLTMRLQQTQTRISVAQENPFCNC